MKAIYCLIITSIILKGICFQLNVFHFKDLHFLFSLMCIDLESTIRELAMGYVHYLHCYLPYL